MRNLKLNDLRNAYEINSDEELQMLYWAYMFNKQYNQDNQFDEALAKEISILLSVDFHADINTVVASLIYKTAKKCKCSDKEIENMFNSDVKEKVKILSRFSDSSILTDIDKEWFIKTILLDVKTTIIKLVERVAFLHNISDEKNINKIINDTLDFYVPLSQLLGIYKIKNNLEDLCFRYDKNYDETSVIVNKAIARNGEIIKYVLDKFNNSNIDFKDDVEFKLNKKSNYEIYLKSKKLSENVGIFHNDTNFKISGFCSIKCLTKTKAECYKMLSFIHDFRYKNGSFCDYISDFQGDEYRALHTNVFIRSHLVDFRICTKEMNDINLYGVTYNWKNDSNLQAKLTNFYKFYDELIGIVGNDLPRDIISAFKTEIIDKRVDVTDYQLDGEQKTLK